MTDQIRGRLAGLLPDRLRRPLTRLHARLVSTAVGANLLGYHGERERVLEYWRRPRDDRNLPQRYLNEHASRRLLVEIVKKHADPTNRVLEVGCNAGANLFHLYQEGYTRLGGIEINADALRLLRETYPAMAAHAELHSAALEEVVRSVPDGAFDVVFTMAVLEHIHGDSEWTFGELVRITRKFLITIEDERSSGWSHFGRNYGRIFRRLGMKQVESIDCRGIDGLGEGFIARVFTKNN